jgi:hypothetical protein
MMFSMIPAKLPKDILDVAKIPTPRIRDNAAQTEKTMKNT